MNERRNVWAIVLRWALLLVPLSASANAGVPMLMLAWPLYAFGLIPIVVLESFIGVRELGLSWSRAFSITTIGNLWSTFVGIPLTWLGMLAVEAVVGLSLGSLEVSGKVEMLFFPFLVAWVPGFDNIWMYYAAFVILSIPFCIVSIWVERKVALRRLPELRAEAVRSWIMRANVLSYGAMVAFTAILAAPKGNAP